MQPNSAEVSQDISLKFLQFRQKRRELDVGEGVGLKLVSAHLNLCQRKKGDGTQSSDKISEGDMVNVCSC